MLAQTRLLVPKTLPINREAASSAASVVMPAMKTVTYMYLLMNRSGALNSQDYTVAAPHGRERGDGRRPPRWLPFLT